MLEKLLERWTGKDDLERVASRENLDRLNSYLRTRRVIIPCRPRRFLDPTGLTKEAMLEFVEKEMHELATGPFEPWVFESSGKRRLPVFSSQKKVEAFTRRVTEDMKKVF